MPHSRMTSRFPSGFLPIGRNAKHFILETQRCLPHAPAQVVAVGSLRDNGASPTERAPIMDAKTADARTHEFDAQDVEYIRHGDKPLLARGSKPRGEGQFPALV